MTINRTQISGQQINGGLYETLSGTLVTVQQEVRTLLSGTLVTVEQEVELRETLSGTLVTVEQTIQGSTSGTLVTISQRVSDAINKTVLESRGYDAEVFIGGYQLDNSTVTDDITIEFNEDAGAVATVVLFGASGVQDLGFFYGKEIKINVITSDQGVLEREFTGIVDIVEFDVLDGKTTLQCTDRRRELMDSISAPQAIFGSGYNVSLIEQLEGTNGEIIDKLLPYAPYSLDFDAQNQYHYTAWEPKATADITLSSSQVYRRDPTPRFINRNRITNRVNIEFTYSHPRLHNAKVQRGVNTGQGSNWGQSLIDGKTLLSRQTVEAVTSGGGWQLSGSINYTPLPSPGWYGRRYWAGDRQISKTTDTGTTSSGSAIRTASPIATYNANGANCLAATWDVFKRWTQTIQKNYQITVQSSTSQAFFNDTVTSDVSYVVSDTYDDERWLNPGRFTNTYDTGAGVTINAGISGYTDIKPQEGLALSNLQAAIARAQTEILKTHRENTVDFIIPLRTGLGLHKTLELATRYIEAKGKITKYRHVIGCNEDDAYTEVQIKFYSLGSGGSTSGLSIPSLSTTSPASYPPSETYGARYGVELPSNPDTVRPGFYGNKYKSGVYTTITPQLIIDYPAIQGGLTDDLKFTATNNYTIAIPTNTATITYD